MSKIKDEQLEKLQSIVADINKAQISVGQLETQKHTILHQLSDFQVKLNELQLELEKEYGKVSINIQDGTYEPIEETVGPEVLKDESNKKD